MPISSEHIGRSYPPSPPFRVTAGKIAEFARALGDGDPAYAGENPIAPPTFGVLLANWESIFADTELDLDLARTMHIEQRFALVRPLRAGDEVTSTVTISGVRQRGPVDMISVESSIDSTDGEHLATLTTSLFHTREESS